MAPVVQAHRLYRAVTQPDRQRRRAYERGGRRARRSVAATKPPASHAGCLGGAMGVDRLDLAPAAAMVHVISIRLHDPASRHSREQPAQSAEHTARVARCDAGAGA